MEATRSESERRERSELNTHGPFLRSMDSPVIEAVAESEYDTWWDDGFVNSDAT